MALFGDKFKSQWQGDADHAGWKDKIGVLGLGISQLSAGQTPNIMPAWQAVEDRRAKRKLNDAMGNPEFVSGFTPQQQAMLSSMPPEMAQSLIMEKMFAPPKDPVKADWQTFGGDMYNMNDIDSATGKPRMTFDGQSPEQVDAGKRTADRELRRQDGMMLGYADGSPEMNNYLVTGKPINEGGNEAGLQPFIGLDKDGNQVMLQPTKDGTVIQSKMPDGVTPDFSAMSFEKAQGTALGKGAGETVVAATDALPGVASMAKLVDQQVQDLKSDPYLPNMLGAIDSRLPNVSSDAARVQSRIDQLQGGAFLQARQLLKQGGQITDYEGGKAEAAFIRMSTAQNEVDFKAALDEFNDAVKEGVKKLQAQAGGGTAATVPQYKDDAAYLKAMGLE